MNRLKTTVLMVLIVAICAIFSGCMGGEDDFSDGISDGTEISTEYNSENEQTSESETVTGDNSGTESKDSSSEDIGEWTPVIPGK